MATTDTIYFGVKNWEKFQQYKDGRPLRWIKLHLALQSDYEFAKLPEATQLHLIRIWLLAAERGNRLPLDPVWITRQIDAQSPVDLCALLEGGWIVPLDGTDKAGALKSLSDGDVRNSTISYRSVHNARSREESREEKSTDVSSLRSSTSEAAPRVENSQSGNGGNRWSETVEVCQRYAWQGDDPPGEMTRGRELSIAKRLTESGFSVEEVPQAVQGQRLLADRGRLPHIRPGDPFSLRSLEPSQRNGGMQAARRALHAYRKHEARSPPEERGGMERLSVG